MEDNEKKDYFSPNVNEKSDRYESANSCTVGSNAGSCVTGNSADECVTGSSPNY